MLQREATVSGQMNVPEEWIKLWAMLLEILALQDSILQLRKETICGQTKVP